VAILSVALMAASCNRNSNPAVSGTIEIDEVHVASRYGGARGKNPAQEGDTLKPGRSSVELEASELETRRNQAAAALADLVSGPRKEEIQAAKKRLGISQGPIWNSQAPTASARLNSSRKKTISASERDHAVMSAEQN